MSRRAAFLDRDGVLVETLVRNNRAFAPVSLDEFRLEPDAGLQVTRLAQAGLLPIVVTNQPEVARGIIPPAVLEEMHERLREAVPVEDIFVCVHDGPAGCECRKPSPGCAAAAESGGSICALVSWWGIARSEREPGSGRVLHRPLGAPTAQRPPRRAGE